MIIHKIDGLAEDPFAVNPNIKRLVGRPECRLRVGDWRVLYLLQHERLVVEVVKIGPRGGVYT